MAAGGFKIGGLPFLPSLDGQIRPADGALVAYPNGTAKGTGTGDVATPELRGALAGPADPWYELAILVIGMNDA